MDTSQLFRATLNLNSTYIYDSHLDLQNISNHYERPCITRQLLLRMKLCYHSSSTNQTKLSKLNFVLEFFILNLVTLSEKNLLYEKKLGGIADNGIKV